MKRASGFQSMNLISLVSATTGSMPLLVDITKNVCATMECIDRFSIPIFTIAVFCTGFQKFRLSMFFSIVIFILICKSSATDKSYVEEIRVWRTKLYLIPYIFDEVFFSVYHKQNVNIQFVDQISFR